MEFPLFLTAGFWGVGCGILLDMRLKRSFSQTIQLEQLEDPSFLNRGLLTTRTLASDQSLENGI